MEILMLMLFQICSLKRKKRYFKNIGRIILDDCYCEFLWPLYINVLKTL